MNPMLSGASGPHPDSSNPTAATSTHFSNDIPTSLHSRTSARILAYITSEYAHGNTGHPATASTGGGGSLDSNTHQTCPAHSTIKTLKTNPIKFFHIFAIITKLLFLTS
ncbi:hypothetical protein [uncultured Zoogloea sp.]|uniref:hypothetical protein n=1 Tax=uncultured Zoogloea sp. TaxID=160237 RepID=UPI002629F735|nr:hypothetical protein [uncultured Zoogloea sp.]